MRSVERIEQSELSPIFLHKTFIEILELYFQTVFINLFIFFILSFFLWLEHWMKWLQIVLSLGIEVVKVSRSLSLQRKSTGIIKSRLYGCCRFDWNNTESLLWTFRSKCVFADGTVSYWSICWVLPDCFKHNK